MIQRDKSIVVICRLVGGPLDGDAIVTSCIPRFGRTAPTEFGFDSEGGEITYRYALYEYPCPNRKPNEEAKYCYVGCEEEFE